MTPKKDLKTLFVVLETELGSEQKLAERRTLKGLVMKTNVHF